MLSEDSWRKDKLAIKSLPAKLCSFSLGQRVGDKLTKLSKLGFRMKCLTADLLAIFWVGVWVLAIGSKDLRDFLEISYFPMSEVVRQLVRQLVH